MPRPRVLLADDHQPVLERVALLLEAEFDVVGVANDGRTLVNEAIRLEPDLIVLDIAMPVLSGIEAAHELQKARLRAKLVFLTVHQGPAFVRGCFAEGGLGYVTKSRMITDLIPAMHEALAERHFISPSSPR